MVIILVLLLIKDAKYDHQRVVWIILIVWLIKDIAMYPFVWRAYDPEFNKVEHQMKGLTGIVTKTLDPLGAIKVNGELWRAEVMEPGETVKSGERVVIEDIQGLTLLVRRPNE
jgi:membrane protein implicated in regulation of membrane protease activity